MIRTAALIITLALSLATSAQPDNTLYRPEEDAEYELSKSVKLASALNRNVFVQVGGNWCAPCIRFHNFISADIELSQLLHENFIVYHLNYSKENQNLPILERYNNPHKLNFPVFLVLDTAGKLLHTQKVMDFVNSMGYDRNRIIAFLQKWKPSSLVADRPKSVSQ